MRPRIFSVAQAHRASRRVTIVGALLLAIVGGLASPALATIAAAPTPGTGGVQWGVDGRVNALLRVGNTVYLGGSFSNALASDGSIVPRSNLAAIDATTGALTSWAPQADQPVFALATDGTDILVGGGFTSVNATPRLGFAAVLPDGSLDSWTIDANRRVRAFTIVGSTLYLGGSFVEVDGVRRMRLAAVDLSSSPKGSLLPWNPKAKRGAVFSLASFSNGNIVVGGEFKELGGDPTQSFISQVLPDGTVGTWTAHPIDLIWSIVVVNDVAYAGRGGAEGGSLQAYSTTGAELWNFHADGDVQAVTYANGQIIAGGHFGKFGLVHIPRLAAFTLLTKGAEPDTTWIPDPNSIKGVWALAGTPDTLYAGGDFTSMNAGATPLNRFAQFGVS